METWKLLENTWTFRLSSLTRRRLVYFLNPACGPVGPCAVSITPSLWTSLLKFLSLENRSHGHVKCDLGGNVASGSLEFKRKNLYIIYFPSFIGRL